MSNYKMENLCNQRRPNPKSLEYSKWSVTLTFCPKVCAVLHHTEQYEYFMPKIIEQLGKSVLFKAVNISFELTKISNLHVHFAIETHLPWTIRTMRNQLDLLFPRSETSLFGFYFITPSNDWDGWNHYINKCQYFYETYKYAF